MTRVAADVLPAIREWLDAQLAGADVDMSVPEDWTVSDGPLLIVADDGGPVTWPIKSQHTIRCTGWAAGRSKARQITAAALGLLGDGRPDGVAHASPNMGGIIDARDPRTGAYLASGLVIIQARTVEV